jgi:glycosyltransferase involved in cell wall biosynthesis
VRRVGCKRVEVVPNCIDICDAPPQRPADDSKDELKVLYLGWVLPAKGVSELIEAVATIDGISLTIIGPRIESTNIGIDNASWLESALSSPGARAKVTMSGPIDSESARAAYLEHDIFVLPSHREGFPNVVLEAMDAAMPIIATRVGAIPEMIVDGEHGLLIDASDVSALSEKLVWMRDHPKERLAMGNAARHRVEELYSVDRVVALWKDLYRRAAFGI